MCKAEGNHGASYTGYSRVKKPYLRNVIHMVMVMKSIVKISDHKDTILERDKQSSFLYSRKFEKYVVPYLYIEQNEIFKSRCAQYYIFVFNFKIYNVF